MSRSNDAWYIRLPDAKVMHAKSTRAVRHFIESGRIPPGSHARRSEEENWTPLHKFTEFADLIPEPAHARREPWNGATAAERRRNDSWSGMQLTMLGVQGMVSELISAMDSSLVPVKLRVAFWTAVCYGLILLVSEAVAPGLDRPWLTVFGVGQSIGLLLTAAVSTALLTQFTFIELSELRAARWREARRGLLRYAGTLIGCYVLVVGGILLLFFGVERGYAHVLTLAEGDSELVQQGGQWLIGGAVVLRLLLQAALLPFLGFALLFGPIVIVEECSVGKAIGRWTSLIVNNGSRLFLYEALTAGIALVAALPLLIPVEFALANAPTAGLPGRVAEATAWMLRALAFVPTIAYMKVANVFIYLHLRYQQPPAGG